MKYLTCRRWEFGIRARTVLVVSGQMWWLFVSSPLTLAVNINNFTAFTASQRKIMYEICVEKNQHFTAYLTYLTLDPCFSTNHVFKFSIFICNINFCNIFRITPFERLHSMALWYGSTVVYAYRFWNELWKQKQRIITYINSLEGTMVAYKNFGSKQSRTQNLSCTIVWSEGFGLHDALIRGAKKIWEKVWSEQPRVANLNRFILLHGCKYAFDSERCNRRTCQIAMRIYYVFRLFFNLKKQLYCWTVPVNWVANDYFAF